jgi:hypothetical protein
MLEVPVLSLPTETHTSTDEGEVAEHPQPTTSSGGLEDIWNLLVYEDQRQKAGSSTGHKVWLRLIIK